ncbi:hypothetical protein ACA910_002998 [Epithemia clementina (nom. ined.)]
MAEKPTIISRDNLWEATTGKPPLLRVVLSHLVGLKNGSLTLQLPDGEILCIEGSELGANGVIELQSYDLLQRVLDSGDVGVGESFVDGEWSSPDVTDVMLLFCQNQQMMLGRKRSCWASLFLSFIQWRDRNTKTGSKRNISAHYDLGNSFYEKWLDPSMTYSSALFNPTSNQHQQEPKQLTMDDTGKLENAQKAKYESLIDRVGIGANDHVLEIGCGWGGFAEYAAQTKGCKVTCLTISREQLAYAEKRIADAGLADKVEILFRDYREEQGVYDRIVSIEMFEAVGEEYWPTYFDCLNKCLKPGGSAGIQVITIQEQLFDRYRQTTDFIQRYIFPGGMLPTPTILTKLGNERGLNVTAELEFGKDYAATLVHWRKRFQAAWSDIEKINPNFDLRFKRMWEFYLHYCEAGFTSGNIDVRQIVFLKKEG